MINIDLWYRTPAAAIDELSWMFYPGEGFRGNLYSCGECVGDYTADTIQEIKKTFPAVFED